MDTVIPSSLVEARWYVWATTPAKARAYVTSYLGLSLELKAKATGLVRPQGYDYTYDLISTGEYVDGVAVTVEDIGIKGLDLFGTTVHGGQDSSDDSLNRYRVDAV